jgi:hypothetical protein
MAPNADRNLLLGNLAMKLEFISMDALIGQRLIDRSTTAGRRPTLLPKCAPYE